MLPLRSITPPLVVIATLLVPAPGFARGSSAAPGGVKAPAQSSAQMLQDAARAARSVSSPERQAALLAEIAAAQARAGQRSAAAETLARALAIELPKLNNDSVSVPPRLQLAVAQAWLGQAAEARATVAVISRRDERVRALTAVAQAQLGAGFRPEGLATFHQAREVALQPPTPTDDAHQVSTLVILADAQHRAGVDQEAGATLAEAFRIVRADPSSRRRLDDLCTVATHYAMIGASDEAAAVIDEVRNLAAEVGPLDSSQVGNLASALAAVGQLEAALQTARTLPAGSSRAWALCRIAEAQARGSRATDAARSLTEALQGVRSGPEAGES